MDLSTIANETRVIDIVHPADGQKTGVRVTVRSKESTEVRAATRKWQNKLLRSQQKTLSADDVEKQSYDILVASVASWDWGDVTWEGQVPEFTPENVRAILSDPRGGFIRDQIDSAYGDQAGFFST